MITRGLGLTLVFGLLCVPIVYVAYLFVTVVFLGRPA